METVQQNPILTAYTRLFGKGNDPINLYIDGEELGVPSGIRILLDDGQEIRCAIEAKDRKQFMAWHHETSNWWAKRQAEDIRRV